MLGVLRIGYGMESMEFITGGRLLRFLNHADMGTIIPDSGIIGGFSESDLPIIGNNQPVIKFFFCFVLKLSNFKQLNFFLNLF